MADTNQINHLKELGSSKYELVAGESDIRGWTVKNDFGRILGKVTDLILDTKAQRIKYFILDTDSNELYMLGRKLLLPLEHAELDVVYKNVIFPGLNPNELSSLPTYEKSSLTNRTEEIIASTFRNFRSGKADERPHNRQDNYQSPAPVATSQGLVDKSLSSDTKKRSVAGVFSSRSEAESAVLHLIDNGFNKGDVHISLRDEEAIERGELHKKEGISGFFSNLFSSEESSWLHSDEARKFPVVIADHLSIAEAERAAEILDRHGAINIDEGLKNFRDRQSPVLSTKKYRSRIIDR